MADDDDDTTSTDSTPSFRYRWDVFLSFRGETRHTITENLYNALLRNGVRTFRDNEGLNRGDEINSNLLEAIEDSAASIAIISEGYASSRWCLQELTKIIECRRLLLPVFYQVDPSDVRRQKGPFEKDFRILEERFGVEHVRPWRKALEKAGGIAGWYSRIWDEQTLIDSLVKEVLNKLSNTPLGVAKYPTGLNSQLEEVMKKLDVKANGVRVLGLHGMGGVGKTTLAKAVFNKLVIHFRRGSFISSVSEIWKNHNGSTSLQSKLIGDLSSSAIKIGDVSEGIVSIKGLIDREEPVLVVLDDIDDVEQLHALACRRDWFYEGSRFIITTRDKEVLHESFVNELHEVNELNPSESLQLFSYHAFGRDKPAKDFMNLSKQIVSLAGGLPLALEVFGSFLFDKRRRKEWDDALRKLERIPPGRLQDVLKISFNGLDEQEKCIFLDIACFFVKMNMKREDAIDVFRGCDFNAEIAIKVLTSRSLIKIIENDTLWMHDLLRDMGRQIVQCENNGDPGMRSRLWERGEILTALKNKKGTNKIQGIVLDFEKKHDLSSEEICWNNFKKQPGFSSAVTYLKEIYKTRFHHGAENGKDVMLLTTAFKPMLNLRLLQINWLKLSGSFRFMPAGVKWLQWKGCFLKNLPYEFCLGDLAVLDLSESKITQLWGWRWWVWSRKKMAEKLLVLNLHNCRHLTTIPDLSGHPVLEKLILENCEGLVKIHKSVGDLSTLLLLNLKGCSNLVEFPTDVSGLKHLEKLILSGCRNLTELPEDIHSMKSLRELLVDETAIVKLPDTIFHLQKLEKFSLSACRSLKELPDCIGKLSLLRELYLNDSALEKIPDSIGSLVRLEKLSLARCSSLTSIPDSLGSLKSLIELFLNGTSIIEIPSSIRSLTHLKTLTISHCRSLSKLPDSIEGLASLEKFWLEGTLIKEVPEQLGSLTMVKQLEMRNCKLLGSIPKSIGKMLSLTSLALTNSAITELPESIGKLERLVTLQLNNCKQLNRLPNSIGNLNSLQYLYMEDTAVTELPEDFGMLSSLQILKMTKSPHSEEHLKISEHIVLDNPTAQESPKLVVLPTSFSNLSSLKELYARGWRISGKIGDDFEKLSTLEFLNLGKNSICSLPSSLRGLSNLKKLLLPHCKELKSLPPLPSSLVNLDVADCTALESISDLSDLKSLQDLNLTNCKKIIDIPGLDCLRSLRRLYTSGCSSCFLAVKKRLSKVALKNLRYLCVPGSEIPNWFVQEIPRFTTIKNRDIKGVVIGVVISLDQQKHDNFQNKLPAIVDVQAKIVRFNDTIFTTVLHLLGVPETDDDQLYLCRFKEYNQLVFMLKDGDSLHIAIRDKPLFNGLALKKYGIHLIYENDDDIVDDDDEEWLHESKQSVSYRLAKFFNSL